MAILKAEGFGDGFSLAKQILRRGKLVGAKVASGVGVPQARGSYEHQYPDLSYPVQGDFDRLLSV